MGTVTLLAPANPQWVRLELETMGVLRRFLGNESPFGWCDFIISTEPSGPCAEFCDHFGSVVRLTRVDRRYEVTCLRTGASKAQLTWDALQHLSERGGVPGRIPTCRAQRSTKPADFLPLVAPRISAFAGKAEMAIALRNVCF